MYGMDTKPNNMAYDSYPDCLCVNTPDEVIDRILDDLPDDVYLAILADVMEN